MRAADDLEELANGVPACTLGRGGDQGTPTASRLEVVIEPTGPAWLPIALFFIDRGHLVYRVSSAKSADLRRSLSKHAKTN